MTNQQPSTVSRTDRGGVCFLEIENAPLNLVDLRLITDLEQRISALEKDESIRVVVFRSRHPDFFVNHFDLSGRSGGGGAAMPARELSPVSALYVRLANLPQITIGEIRGRTRGAGAEFALALDMRFASIEYGILGQPEAGVGLHPGAGGCLRLAELVGRARALEIMASGADYSAEVAERYGWVNRALPDAELGAYVDALAQRIASFPAVGLHNLKTMVNAVTLPKDELLVEEELPFPALTPESGGPPARSVGFFTGCADRGPHRARTRLDAVRVSPHRRCR